MADDYLVDLGIAKSALQDVEHNLADALTTVRVALRDTAGERPVAYPYLRNDLARALFDYNSKGEAMENGYTVSWDSEDTRRLFEDFADYIINRCGLVERGR